MKLDLTKGLIKEKEYFSRDYQKKIKDIYEKIHSTDQSAGLAWVNYPVAFDKKEFAQIANNS